MKRFPFAIIPLLAGCATVSGHNAYVARGENPEWFLSIGDSVIRFTVGHAERHQVSPLEVLHFPRVDPVRVGDGYVWTSSPARGRIVIETEFAPHSSCSAYGPETVRVVVGDREFRGCGGEQILVSAD